MAWFDFDVGNFGVNLPEPSSWSMPSMDFSPPSLNMPSGWSTMDIGRYGSDTGGGGGFSLPNLVREWSPVIDLARTGLTTGLGIQQQLANRRYQEQLQDYYRQRQAMEQQYNTQMMDYLRQRREWEAGLMEQWGGMMEGFGEHMGGFQEQMAGIQQQMAGIVTEQLNAARPLLEQSRDLLEPAVASLARGEVPPIFAPILDQVRQRARAAAMQQYASAGIDAGTAAASIDPAIDQQAQQMLLAQVMQMLGGGQQLAQTGGQFLGQAGQVGAAQGQLAIGAMTPVMQEFQAMMSALSSLFGSSSPGLTPMMAPPAPVA